MAKERLARFCKEKMVDELLEQIKVSPNFIITSYMGSSVSDLESLRRGLKKFSSNYVVVKNSIAKIALEKIDLKSECDKVDGGVGISLSGEDIVATCKTLVTFAKGHEKFKIKGGIIDGSSVSSDKIATIAALPSKQVLLAQVVTGIKSPITGFVNTLGGILRKFVYVVDAIKTAKGNVPAEGAAQEVKA